MISVPGVGSGLDINSIVSQLVAVEGDTKTLLLANQQTGIESEITAFGSIKSILSTLQSSTATLKSSSTFSATKASSSDESIFTATTSGNVNPGQFTIEVRELAEANKLISDGYTDADTVIGEGTLSISIGTESFDVSIDSSNSTVAGIRNAINDASDNTGISATIINVDDGAGGTESKLVLTANDTGSNNAITVTVNDTDGIHTDSSGLSALYYDTSDATTPEQLSEIRPAMDAEIYVDNQRVYSNSNTVVDAIQGVTLNLLAEDTGKNHTLTISNDKESVKSTVELFVSNYNSFVSLTNNMTAFTADTGAAGIFLGDATVRTLQQQLRGEMTGSVDDISGPFSMLLDLGITTESDGSLKINPTTLDNALDSNLQDVAELFSSTNGIAIRLDSVLNEYTKSDGIIDNKTDGLNTTIDGIESEFEKLQNSLDALEERLLAQFAALDILVSQLNSTASFLDQQFQSLANINKPK